MVTLRVNYRDGNAGEQSAGDIALLVVGEPIVFERERQAFNTEGASTKSSPSFLRLEARFASDPVNSMRWCIYIPYVPQDGDSAA